MVFLSAELSLKISVLLVVAGEKNRGGVDFFVYFYHNIIQYCTTTFKIKLTC